MDIVTDLEGWSPPTPGTVVTIGVYDGVHVGHQAVIASVRERAAALGLSSVVVTFDPHPATVVRPASAPKMLTDLVQRLDVLGSIGVDATVVIRFDEARSQEEPEDFVREVLVNGVRARVVVVGEGFHFGRRRRGDVALLQNMGRSHGFEVVRVDAFTGPHEEAIGTRGEPVSSTAIRELVAAGSVAGAARLLGRQYEVRGVVAKGAQRGAAELGFPTANVETRPDILLPGLGIYVGWYERPDGNVYGAAISVGRRPTFYPSDAPVVAEAYLLDFQGDLYGEKAKLRFAARLRDELRFTSREGLVAQMRGDVEATRAALSEPVDGP